MNINTFSRKLNLLRKNFEYNPYEGGGRDTHCLMVYKNEHIFEVRSWRRDRVKNRIIVNAVNWTMAAGPCTIELTLKNLSDWQIKDIN